jgi:hypothetical protein
MSQPAKLSSANRTGSFAGLLACLAAPAEKLRSDWNDDDGLADDITTLSYKQALRTHASCRPKSELPPLLDAADEQLPQNKLPPKETVGAESTCGIISGSVATETRRSMGLDESRKAASITVRLSKAECAQLHERATEAGLTVSAYLRSCTCEVEALRAQVKETLARLRPLGAVPEHRPGIADEGIQRSWWSRLILLWGGRNASRV